jgi:hypothetical protein
MSKIVQSRCQVTKDTEKELLAETRKLQRQGWELDGRVRSAPTGVRWRLLPGNYEDEEEQFERVPFLQYTQKYVRYRA